MKRMLGVAAFASLVMFGAACDDSPTSPSEETVTFTAQLLPANEVPPVANAEASGTGTTVIELRVSRNDAGTIIDAEADFQVNLTGFPVDTPVTMAHIHTGSAGQNGEIVVNTGLVAGQVTLGTGSGSFSRNGIDVSPAVAQSILTTPAGFYFNVHSVINPGGMARGQLVRQ